MVAYVFYYDILMLCSFLLRLFLLIPSPCLQQTETEGILHDQSDTVRLKNNTPDDSTFKTDSKS